jgi:hypothetical protein
MLLLDLKDTHAIPGAALLPSHEIDRRNGNNAGNFAFRYALTRRFFPEAVPGTFAMLNSLEAPEAVAVMACSNWIGLSPEHEQANQDRFESLNSAAIRTVPIGLGCQIPEGTRFEQLGPWTRRFLGRLAESSPSMSVRDEQTAEVLGQMGYRHCVVTGCPSNFINPDPYLGAHMAARLRALLAADATWSDVAICMTEYSGGYEFSADLFRRQHDLMVSHGATYVIQDLPLLPVLMGETADLPVEYSLLHFPGMAPDEATLARTLRRHSVYYSGFDDWMLQMRRFDTCFGMRLHGNMAALQVGVPSLILTHDARTAQLCRTMSLPHLHALQWLALPVTHPRRMWEGMLPALETYDARRRELAGLMRDHLVACGLAIPQALSPFLSGITD